jgi:hypothetical protein
MQGFDKVTEITGTESRITGSVSPIICRRIAFRSLAANMLTGTPYLVVLTLGDSTA